MIKNVIFDFADTIAELNPRKEDILSGSLYKKFAMRIDREYIIQAYKLINDIMHFSTIETVKVGKKEAFIRNTIPVFS